MLTYLSENDSKFLKTEIPDNRWNCLFKKFSYPYKLFNSFDDYQKPVDNLKKADFFSKLKNVSFSDEEIERSKEQHIHY